MPIRVSRALGVSHRSLIKEGAFDGFIDVDSLLYVDPHLLPRSKAPELATAADSFERYFTDVLRVLTASKKADDLPWAEAVRRLTFPELPNVALGHAKGTTRGHAIGRGTARGLAQLAKEIVELGIQDPNLFELLGLLQEGVGPDLISDMTIHIIRPEIFAFSTRVADKLGLRTVSVADSDGENVTLPATRTGQPLVLIPADVLRHIPVAKSWDDIDTVAAKNTALRRRVNAQIGSTWRRATSAATKKKALREALLRNPELITDLLQQYKAKGGEPYDFKKDPAGVQVWFDVAEEVAAEWPLDLVSTTSKSLSPLAVAELICSQFKKLVESSRLSRLLYNDDGTPRKERTAQLFFFALSLAYCEANDIDVSPESDAGAGPVDFKFSRGATAKATVEVKLTSNPNLIHGYESQLPTYNRAENASSGILLVVRNGDHAARIKGLQQVVDAAEQQGRNSLQLILVDGRPRRSASKR